MSNETEQDDDYAYDEKGAVRADDAASRLSDNGPYVGVFTKAQATVSAEKGTRGVILGFDSPGSGNAEFTLWTKSADGVEYFGKAQLDAIMFLLGIKGTLKAQTAMVEEWVDVGGKREKAEVEGKIYPDLIGKPIGCVFQKELYTGKSGTGERLNLVGNYQAETKLMMSEIKERKTTPVKLDRLVRGLKTKDSRKPVAAEPAQPSVAGDGGY